MGLQERCARRFGIRQFRPDEALSPACRKDDRVDVYAFGVIPELFMEQRELTDSALDVICLRSVEVVEEGDVCLHRGSRSDWQFVLFIETEDRLQTDNEHIVVLGDPTGAPQHVGKAVRDSCGATRLLRAKRLEDPRPALL